MLQDAEQYRPIDMVDLKEVVAEFRQLRDMREMKKESGNKAMREV